MRFCGFMVVLLWFVCGSVSAQTDWKALCEKSPKTALAKSDSLYAQAAKAKDYPKQVLALIVQARCKSLIDESSLLTWLMRSEEVIAGSRDSVERCVLRSLAAELFLQYYDSHRNEVDHRRMLDGVVPESIEEWSKNVFTDRIVGLTRGSLSGREALKSCKVDSYRDVLLRGKDSELLRPTMFDLLSHRGIRLFVELTDGESASFKGLTEGYGVEHFFSNYGVFSRDSFPVSGECVFFNVMDVYRDLIVFHAGEGNEDALVMVDLERLNYVRSVFPGHDSLYFSGLESLLVDFPASPFCVEMMDHLVRYYKGRAYAGGDEAMFQKAIDLCRSGISRFPDYPRIEVLKVSLRDMEEPRLSASFSNVVYPGKLQCLKLVYRNVSECRVRISRLEGAHASYLQWGADGEKLHSERVLVWEEGVLTRHSPVEHDTAVYVVIPETGLYEFEVLAKGVDGASGCFISTRLAPMAQSVDKSSCEFLVRDFVSGKPVQDVEIDLFSSSMIGYTKRMTVSTDKDGLALIKSPLDDRFYNTTDASNSMGIMTRLTPYFSPGEAYNEGVSLFTDRSVYRPGDALQFTGIAWRASADTIVAQENMNLQVVFRDANGRVIDIKKFRSDGYGSFNGRFVVPEGGLNGSYHVDVAGWGDHTVQVAEYKRPRTEVRLVPGAKVFYFGDTVVVRGSVQSYAGVGEAGCEVSYEVALEVGYRLSVNPSLVKKGVARCDDAGNFEFSFVSQAPTDRRFFRHFPWNCYVKATATDGKGESLECDFRVRMGERKRELTLSMERAFLTGGDAVARWASSAKNLGSLHFRVSKLAALKRLGDSYVADSCRGTRVIGGGVYREGCDSISFSLAGYESGAYLLEMYESGDVPSPLVGRQVFYVYSLKDKRPPVLNYCWVMPVKTDCRAGEDARVQLGSSAKDVHVYYELYGNDRRISREVMVLSDENRMVHIPYKSEYGDEICAVFSFIRDERFFCETVRIRKSTPERVLSIRANVFRDKLKPGTQERWRFRIEDYRGQGQQAQLAAVMYDAALDAIVPHRWHFHPSYNFSIPFTRWMPGNERGNWWLQFHPDRKEYAKVPNFQFDALNLLGLSFRSNFGLYGSYDSDESSMITDAGSSIRPQSRAMYKSMASGNGAEAEAADVPEADVGEERVSIRENFQETAFFYPQLASDSAGVVTVDFVLPESLTRWKFMALAHTQGMAYNFISREVTTSKDFMVNPLFPRFLRQEDVSVLRATINNLSEQAQDGKVYMELFDPQSDEVLVRRDTVFSIAAGKSETVGFSFRVPQGVAVAGCRFVARNEDFSDGEQQLVPIVSNRVVLTEALPFFPVKKGSYSYKFRDLAKDVEISNLTVEATANPIWYAVTALPSLQEYRHENATEVAASFYVNAVAAHVAQGNPGLIRRVEAWKVSPEGKETLRSPLERNEELKSVLLEASPWQEEARHESEQMASLAMLLDVNRSKFLQKKALNKLSDLECSEGGWSWFKGMPASYFMTNQILTLMARAVQTGEVEYGEREKRMQICGLRFMDGAIKKEFTAATKRKEEPKNEVLYLYMRSLYRDIPLGDALSAHKYYLNQAKRQWAMLSLQEKALLSVALRNYGFREVADEIVASLREYSTSSDSRGMYWANSDRDDSGLSTIAVHSAIMEAFYQSVGSSPEVDRMKQWLLGQKQTQAWGSTPTTVDAIYALLLTGRKLTDDPDSLTVVVGNEVFHSEDGSGPLGYLKRSWSKDIRPDMLQVKLSKVTDNPSWGALYVQYPERLDRVTKEKGDIVNVEKRLFREVSSMEGKRIEPVDENRVLHVGDKLIVRLTFSVERNVEFVHLQDLRAACFEPTEQLSGMEWQPELSFYRETKDVCTNFFFDRLGKGSYVLEYPVWINQAGSFQDGVATLQCQYAPEFVSHSVTSRLEVAP